ncbi:hypothetical protein, partial [Escherichia coli]|uniref:hypothetical protein n=1 Tax=Escherichia coli TaxID=562 RepID=UPI001BC82CAA
GREGEGEGGERRGGRVGQEGEKIGTEGGEGGRERRDWFKAGTGNMEGQKSCGAEAERRGRDGREGEGE